MHFYNEEPGSVNQISSPQEYFTPRLANLTQKMRE